MINLTKKQIEVLKVYLQNPEKKQEELARLCGITQPEFSRLLSRAKKNIEKSINTVKFIKQMGYPIEGEVPMDYIKKLKDVIYMNTLGGELPVSKEHVIRTMERVYGISKEAVLKALAELRDKGYVVERKDGKLVLRG